MPQLRLRRASYIVQSFTYEQLVPEVSCLVVLLLGKLTELEEASVRGPSIHGYPPEVHKAQSCDETRESHIVPSPPRVSSGWRRALINESMAPILARQVDCPWQFSEARVP